MTVLHSTCLRLPIRGIPVIVMFVLIGLLPAEVLSTAAEPYAEYLVVPQQDLQSLLVRLCFPGEVPHSLVNTSSLARRALGNISIGDKALADDYRTEKSILLAALSPGACLQYEVDLKLAAADPGRRRLRQADQGYILLATSSWLWLPDVDFSNRPINISFDLPENVAISVPWPAVPDARAPHSYRMGDFPSEPSMLAIGRVTILNIEVLESNLRLAVGGNVSTHTLEKIRRWVRQGAVDLGAVYGRFPLPAPQILVIPAGRQDEPVPWGQVLRGGGTAMQLFIDTHWSFDSLVKDWTLLHEFSHFLHPNLTVGNAWLSEGLASYYQNVAQARAGVLSMQQAWQKLHDGFQRGKEHTVKNKSLEFESRRMSSSRNYMRVYWSGAAIILQADVHLRKQGSSLDSVLADFQECCLLAARYWSAREFLQKLDTLSQSRIFTELQDKYLYADEFPDLLPVYEELGLDSRDGKIVFVEGSQAAQLRAQIMLRNQSR